jgi:hypothetical protein
VLVWYQSKDSTPKDASIIADVHFVVLELDRLDVIHDTSRVQQQVREQRLPFTVADSSLESVAPVISIPARSSGDLVITGSLNGLNECDELLFFVHADGTRLWTLKPKDGMLTVAPQDWFNKGDFDRGYQWPTRVARDPHSGAIVGDGIRIGTFILDGTHRNVVKWLDQTA